MIQGKTTSGFEYTITDERLDNYELLEKLAEVSENNYGALPKVAEMLLGGEQLGELKEHVRKDGKVSLALMFAEIGEILNTDLKNS